MLINCGFIALLEGFNKILGTKEDLTTNRQTILRCSSRVLTEYKKGKHIFSNAIRKCRCNIICVSFSSVTDGQRLSFIWKYIQWPVQHIFAHMPSWKNSFMNNTLYPVNTGEFTMSIFEILYAISRKNTPAKRLAYEWTDVFIVFHFHFKQKLRHGSPDTYTITDLRTCKFSSHFSENMPCSANHSIEKRRDKNCSFSKFVCVDLYTTHELLKL